MTRLEIILGKAESQRSGEELRLKRKRYVQVGELLVQTEGVPFENFLVFRLTEYI